jgi:hypothetical protein
MPRKPKPKTTSYVKLGSTKITVPAKMIGYDRQLHPHLWNTTTPKRHNIAIHNNIPSINFQVNPNAIRKISRVPFTSQYVNFPNNNPLPVARAVIPNIQRQQVILPPPPPQPMQPQFVPAPVIIQNQNQNQQASKIQAAIRRQQSNFRLQAQQTVPNATALLVRQDIPQNFIYGNNPIFQEERANKTLQAAIRRRLEQQQQQQQIIPQRPPVPIRPPRVPRTAPLPIARAPPQLERINELLNPIEANWIIGDSIKNKLARKELAALRKQKAQYKAATKIQKVFRGKLGRNEYDILRGDAIQEAFIKDFEDNANAEIIQNAFRGKLARNELKTNKAQYKAATKIQKVFRGKLGRNEYDILRGDAIQEAFLKDFEDNNNAEIIQKAFRNYKGRKVKKVMGFDFPLPIRDTPIQSGNYNPTTLSTSSKLSSSQRSLDKSKIPITAMPNVKVIQRAFRNYKGRKEAKIVANKNQQEQMKKAEEAKNVLMKFFKKPAAIMSYKELQEKQRLKNIAATNIQKVIKGVKVRKQVKNNTVINEYKQNLKDINRDEIIETEKIQEKIDYEQRIIDKNSGTIGGILNVFNSKEKEKRKKAVSDAKNTIKIQEDKKKRLKQQLDEKKKKAQQLLQKRLIIIRGESDVDVNKVKKEYVEKLEKIYTDFRQRKKDKKTKLDAISTINSTIKAKIGRNKYEKILIDDIKIQKIKKDLDTMLENNKKLFLEEQRLKYVNGKQIIPKQLAENAIIWYNKFVEYPIEYPEMRKLFGDKYVEDFKDWFKSIVSIIETFQKQQEEQQQEEDENQDEEDRRKIDKINREEEKRRKKLEQKEKEREDYNAKRKEEEKQRKEEEKRLRDEENKLRDQASKDLQEQLKREKELSSRDKHRSMVANLKEIIFKLQQAKLSFENTDKNNIVKKQKELRTYEAILEEYFTYKQTIKTSDWVYVLKEWGVSENDLKQEEKVMASLIVKFKKEIEETQKEKDKAKEAKEKRKEEIKKIALKINELEEEITPLYLTEYESYKDSMTINQRTKLYDKILKLYNKFIIEKQKLSQKEYEGLQGQQHPEWEMFKRIKDEYLNKEGKNIDKLKIEESRAATSVRIYTRAELDAMSIKDIEKLLIYSDDGSTIMAPEKGITSQQDRDIYNAWNRKMNKKK